MIHLLSYVMYQHGVEQSRRKTSWEDVTDLNVTEAFLKKHFIANYEERHRKIVNCDEADILQPFNIVKKFTMFGQTLTTNPYPARGCLLAVFTPCYRTWLSISSPCGAKI
jgi:hypothetical protein